jgi:predicted glutamine amidotransferase
MCAVSRTTRASRSRCQNCHPFHFKDVPLVMAHNGDLARFSEMKPLLVPHLKPGIAAQVHGTT